ncbi:MAG: hypothetical protein KDA24_13380 [Deltaproteobacteria bacterium]|nr:hypothetical protein [Deltaproteobacteria bacterium]
MSEFTTGGIFKGAAIGGAAAGIANIILYFIGGAAGAEYLMPQPGSGELGAIPVPMPFMMSLVPSLLGGAVLVALTKFAGEKAWTIFLAIMGLAFLMMAPGPVMQMGEDTTAIVVLEVMHVVAVLGTWFGISRFGKG